MPEDGSPFPDEDPFPDDMEPPELLMEATVRVLADEGLHGLTLRKVAERAEKNRGLVHYYFESKDDLLASLLDHILSGTKELIGIVDSDAPIDKLWMALRFHAYGPGGIDEAGRDYYLAILQLQALAPHDPDVRRRLTRNHQHMVDVVTAILREGIDEGTFRAVDPTVTAVVLLALIDGARTTDLSMDVDSCREETFEILERCVDEFLLV